MAERVIDVIPRVVVSGDTTNYEFSVVVTDQRTIFVPAKSHSDQFTAWFLGGITLALIEDATAKRKYIQDRNVDPETLTKIVDSRVIPHSSLREVGITKRISGYYLELSREHSRFSSRNVTAKLAPPRDYMAHCKKKGYRRREILRKYATDARSAYEAALSEDIRQSAYWRF